MEAEGHRIQSIRDAAKGETITLPELREIISSDVANGHLPSVFMNAQPRLIDPV